MRTMFKVSARVSPSRVPCVRRVVVSSIRLSWGLARVGRCIHVCRRVRLYQTRGFRQLEQNRTRTPAWVGDGHKNLGRRSTRRNFTTQALLVPQDADVTLALTDGFISASLSLTIHGG